jgi:glycosyltransferase involved in cell wall biosynthesis
MGIKLSIIIPCYNAMGTLEKTLQSVIDQDFQDWEAIIVNDGSTDITEDIALRWVKKDERFKYYAKENEGLGKTRNYGIARSSGLFILPLDSDNQLMKDFAQDAIAVFEKNCEIGVVYGDAECFGEKKGLWKIEQYDLKKILADNYIDACAIFRKKVWVEVGGYDENMPYQGNEDWEFWIALGVLNIKFHHLNKITFKYFVSRNSMIRSFTDTMGQFNSDYIFEKYSKQYQKYYKEVYLLHEKKERNYCENLKSEKFVIDIFCTTFFRFSIFGLYKKNNIKKN